MSWTRLSLRLGLVLGLAVVCASGAETPAAGLVLSQVQRTLDLNSHLAKVTCELTLSNEGSQSVDAFHWVGEAAWSGHVSFVGATVGSGDKTYLRIQSVSLSGTDLPAWKVGLKSPLKAGASVKVAVELILNGQIELFPREIAQRERQLVLFHGHHYVQSVYRVQSQTTKVLLPSQHIESYTKTLKPVSAQDSTLTYGPYGDVAPLTMSAMSVHYENHNPFLVATRVERIIEVSMWGNIAIEETIDLRHSGAKLKGSFSRYEFQQKDNAAAVKSFKTMLPAAASDVYYRDDIGNISTSALRTLHDSVELDLRPRFPLFGGWKTHYFIGYNVPSYEYLYTQGEKYILNMRLVDHVYDDMLVEDFKLQIILPEGAKVGKLHTPYPTLREKDGLHFTYLDTSGRPVISIKNIGDLTEKHIQDFQLEFSYPKISMIHEPLLLIGAFFIFFFLTIIYVRLDFAITKDEGSEVKMKIAGVCEKIIAHQDKRFKQYERVDEALAKYKTSKEAAAFASATKKVAGEASVENQAIADLITSLKAISGDTAEKVAEMQRQDKLIREQQMNQGALVEKLVSGKLTKQQFIDQEPNLVKKRDEAREKIFQIYNQLRSY